MENRAVLIGSIVFVFASFILMIVMLVYESYKAKQMKQLAANITSEATPAVTTARQDYSMYRTIIGDDGREMVQIPEGPFVMGSKDGDPDEAPEHQVYLKIYYMDLKEVTQAEYDRFAKMTKRRMPRVEVFEDDPAKLLKPDLAAMSVSWDDANAFCKWAGKRLPTEAEWEKGARGEGKRKYPWGDQVGIGHANLNGSEDGHKYLAPPGSFESGRSVYGLYDMAGNVSEWVADSYHEKYYSQSPYRDPKGPEETEIRVIRGGSWRESAQNARVSRRFQAKHWRADITIGIRCAKDVEVDLGQK